MPGPNKEIYATATLSICIFTTVVCGGFTERVLAISGMKQNEESIEDLSADPGASSLVADQFPGAQAAHAHVSGRVQGLWNTIDNDYLKVYFGGSSIVQSGTDHRENGRLGNYELTGPRDSDDDDEF
jgi:sodium/hydrogen exchanger 8